MLNLPSVILVRLHLTQRTISLPEVANSISVNRYAMAYTDHRSVPPMVPLVGNPRGGTVAKYAVFALLLNLIYGELENE